MTEYSRFLTHQFLKLNPSMYSRYCTLHPKIHIPPIQCIHVNTVKALDDGVRLTDTTSSILNSLSLWSKFLRNTKFRIRILLPSSDMEASNLVDPLDRAIISHSAFLIQTMNKIFKKCFSVCIYVFCTDLRTNRDYLPIQH
jgi:hypothetical protein